LFLSGWTKNIMLERRALQVAICVGGIVPVSAGVLGVIYGAGFTGGTFSAADDSHFRYLSGLLLAIGLAFWSLVPTVEHAARLARILTALVFVGGLARLAGIAIGGWPSWPMMGGLIMELVVTPALCVWQARIAANAAAGPNREAVESRPETSRRNRRF
jgi:Domain of unknown function (DUF4345)